MWGMKMCSNVPGRMTMPIYGKKIQKTGLTLFPYPSVWVKASTALSAHVFLSLF